MTDLNTLVRENKMNLIVWRDADHHKSYFQTEPDEATLEFDVCKFFAFVDFPFYKCYISKIYYGGREIDYEGWNPGMVFRFYYIDDGTPAFERAFPQWDH